MAISMTTFADLGIKNSIIKGLSSLGFEEPTPVQTQVIPIMLTKPMDLVSLAQTGTGKTAAFGVPLIQLTNVKSKKTQGLILCPTRELCVQVAKDLESFSRHTDGVRILAVYGGANIEPQIRSLKQGVQIIVATPGRLNDLLNRGMVNLSTLRYVVFDEADEMLQMGFKEELDAILEQTPQEKNTMLFSATMSGEVAEIADKYMVDPFKVTVGKRNAGAENVAHEYYITQARNRYPALKRIIDNAPDNYSIVFCRTRQETHTVANYLIQDGYNADALHGDLSQAQRDQVMRKFRNKNLQLLVATDVAARGLDVTDLTHVINYNLPDDFANYTHRSGRTGRAGRAGTSVVIIQARERSKVREIEKRIKKKFKQRNIPSGEDICRRQLLHLIDTVTRVEVDHDRVDPLYADISEQLSSLDREELIKKFISLEFNRFLEYYKDAPDLNAVQGREERHAKKTWQQKGSANGGNRRQKFTRFSLNVGRRDGVMPQGLIGKINGLPGGGRIKVGKIEIMRNTAHLEADSRFAPQILEAFQHVTINGKAVTIKVAQGHQGGMRHRRNSEQYRKGQKYRA